MLYRKIDFLISHFNSDLMEVFGMVTDTLKVVDNMEVRTDNTFVALIDGRCKFDKELCERAVRKVDDLFVLSQAFAVIGNSLFHRNESEADIFLNETEHIVHFFFDLHEGNGRHGKKSVVDIFERELFFCFLLIFDDKAGISDELFDKRQEDDGRCDVKYNVEKRDAHLKRHLVITGEAGNEEIDDRFSEYPDDCGKENSADDVKRKMNERYTLGVCICAYGSEKSGYASTDIRTEDNEKRKIKRKNARADHCYYNTG